MLNMNEVLQDYSAFLKEYNLTIKNIDELTYKKNLKLISSINKINKSKTINPNLKKSSDLKNVCYYKAIQLKIKNSLGYTFNKILSTDKYDSQILKDSNAFFCVLCSLAYYHILNDKPYLDLTKYL